MSILKRIKQVKTEFTKGSVSLEELLLHLEPLLMQVVNNAKDEAEVKKIVNGIERAIYTQIEPQKTVIILELIDQGISFVNRSED
jgi:hypothetical protein